MQYFLGKDLCDFSGAQWAAVTDFAQTGILDHLANLGSSGIIELGGGRGDLTIEKGQDFVMVGNGTSSHVADETSVALSGFSDVQDSENSILIVFSGPLSSAKSSSNEESLEDGSTSKEGSSKEGTTTNGDSSTSSSNSNDNGALSNTGQ